MSLHLNHQHLRDAQVLATDKKIVPPPTAGKGYEFIKTLGLLFVLAFLLRSSVVEAFKIPSQSMEHTLLVGDHILVNKLSYGLHLPFLQTSILQYATPRRGDVVVFTLPEDPSASVGNESLINTATRLMRMVYKPKINIIKRVIGLPGDTVEVRRTEVYINGELYKEDGYSQWVLGGAKDFPPSIVPPGKVLLLGDNRDESRDSRFWKDPFLDINRIKGRAFFIYWNWNNGAPYDRMPQVIH